MKNLLPLFILIFSFTSFGQLKNGSDNLIVYRDELFPFSVFYPKDFEQVVPSHTQTRLKVVSENGLGLSDFSVIAIKQPASAKITSAELVNGLSQRPDIVDAMVKQGLPNAKLITSGKTYLSNKEAFFIKASGTFHNVDNSYNLIIYQFLMAFEGNTYTLTCRAEKEDFEEYFPLCKLMASTFTVRPTKLAIPTKKRSIRMNKWS